MYNSCGYHYNNYYKFYSYKTNITKVVETGLLLEQEASTVAWSTQTRDTALLIKTLQVVAHLVVEGQLFSFFNGPLGKEGQVW